MTVQERKPPKDKKGGKSKPTGEDSPWKHNEDGTRQRVGKKLPYETRLKEFFAGISGVATLAGDSFTAAAIEGKSEELAFGYAKLAQNDPRVKRVISFLLEGSAWTEAIIPTLGLAIVVGWHYGFVPDQLGVPLTVANGMLPLTREQEIAIKEKAAREQAEAEQRKRTDGNGQGGDSKPH